MSAVGVKMDFPGGNGIVSEVSEGPDHLRVDFAADPRNCPEPMWFHFRVEGVGGRELSCRLTNADQTLGGEDWSGNRPVYRGDDGDWQRCGPPVEEATSSGRRLFTFTVPAGHQVVEFAHCYPYQFADLERTLAGTGDAWQGEVVGRSHHGRPIVRLASGFGRATRMSGQGERRPGVYLLARQHAGETPGSWVLDGLLRHLAEDASLREQAVWWAVPFVDIDDVVEGSYGKDPLPVDCNRSWYELPLRTEVVAISRDIRRWAEGCRPRILIDLHAPGHSERETYVHLPRRGRSQRERNLVRDFACRFHEALPEGLAGEMGWTTPSYPSRYTVGTTVSTWFYDNYALPGVGLETSYQGTPDCDYSVADYHRIGQTLATVLADLVEQPVRQGA